MIFKKQQSQPTDSQPSTTSSFTHASNPNFCLNSGGEYCYFCDREFKQKSKRVSVHALQVFSRIFPKEINPLNLNLFGVFDDEDVFKTVFKDFPQEEAEKLKKMSSLGCFDIHKNCAKFIKENGGFFNSEEGRKAISQAKKKYEGKRKKITVSLRKGLDDDLIKYAETIDISNFVKEKLREQMTQESAEKNNKIQEA